MNNFSFLKSGIFALGGPGIRLILNLFFLAALGRLLAPEDFALFGILLAVNQLMIPFSDLGLGPAYIKLEIESKEARNVFFTLNFSLSMLIMIGFITISPILEIIYKNSQLIWLTLAFSITAILRPFDQLRISILNRRKSFGKIFIVNQCGYTLSSLCAVFAAWIGLGVWALIIGALVQSCLRVCILKLYIPEMLKFSTYRSITRYKDSIRFGIEIVINRALTGFFLAFDKLLIGKIYGLVILGNYTRACSLSSMPNSYLNLPLILPALSHLARNPVKAAYHNFAILSNTVILIAGTACILLCITGDLLLPWLLGPKWQVAGTYLQILSIWGMGEIFHELIRLIYLNEMKMKRFMMYNSFSFVIVIIILSLVIFFDKNILWFITSYSVSNLFIWATIFFISITTISGSTLLTFKVLRTFVISIICGIFAGSLSKAWHNSILLDDNYLNQLLIIFAISFGTIIIVSIGHICFNYYQMKEIGIFIKSRLGKSVA
ncbi:MAG: oligosaccharide flippase family protein [Candidatus Hodarchaeota archaeon]